MILCCFVEESLFYAIYAVLSRNLFCRYYRALAWRKIEPKILSVEKKGQISGMIAYLMYFVYLVFCLAYFVFCLAYLVFCLAYLVFCLAYLVFCVLYSLNKLF